MAARRSATMLLLVVVAGCGSNPGASDGDAPDAIDGGASDASDGGAPDASDGGAPDASDGGASDAGDGGEADARVTRRACYYVAVGSAGSLASGPTLAGLVPRTPTTANALLSVVSGGGKFVAVGNEGTLLTSSDGVAWTARDSGTTEQLFDASYIDDTFFLLGTNGVILTSGDAITWADRSIATSARLTGIASDGAEFVVTTDSFVLVSGLYYGGTGLVYRGVPGSWRAENTGAADEGQAAVAYANGRFVVAGGRGKIFTSGAGPSWTRVQTTGRRVTTAAAFGNGLYVVVSGDGAVTSTDASAWTAPVAIAGAIDAVSSLHFDGEKFITGGFSGDVYDSADGNTWSSYASSIGTVLSVTSRACDPP